MLDLPLQFSKVEYELKLEKSLLLNRKIVREVKIEWDCTFKRNRNYKRPYSLGEKLIEKIG